MRSLFGRYSFFLDEMIHVVLSLAVSLVAVQYTDIASAVIIFASAVLIDLDHLLNPVIAGLVRVPHQLFYGKGGYTIKILHGFDVFLLVAILIHLIKADIIFASFIFINLTFHELWDFAVYPHSWKELFLTTRIMTGFRPGMRKSAVGLFFCKNSLKC